MVATRDASYIFQSMLVQGNILAYFSFLKKNSFMKRECPLKFELNCFKITKLAEEIFGTIGILLHKIIKSE